MQLHGPIETNVTAAIDSSRRLKGHPVHADTVSYWAAVLRQARREVASNKSNNRLQELVLVLEQELADHSAA